MKLLLILAVAALSACTTLPPPPDINLYMHHQPSGIVFCSRVKDGTNCPSTTIDQTHKWFMLTPDGWRKLNNYIDELIRRLEAKGLTGGGSVSVNADDLRALKAHLQRVKGGFQYGNIPLLGTESP